ncbi:mucin-3A-like [Paramacrobiotus metropolitanus]|uniref:mucin-3A-like n=1 Tax=Paramacrobiotus metropolitanus TaxID=2943436 RepID=UPI0024464144|nr:mucin-3A-like [Paramacrobiotus metropolitanus]
MLMEERFRRLVSTCVYVWALIMHTGMVNGQSTRSFESAFEALDSLRQNVGRSAVNIQNAVQAAIPGITYPQLSSIPDTSFDCSEMPNSGFYADVETGCQVYRRCNGPRMNSYLCPNGTLFNQIALTCDWWYNVNCSKSTTFYTFTNARLYKSNETLFEEQTSVQPSHSTSPSAEKKMIHPSTKRSSKATRMHPSKRTTSTNVLSSARHTKAAAPEKRTTPLRNSSLASVTSAKIVIKSLVTKKSSQRTTPHVTTTVSSLEPPPAAQPRFFDDPQMVPVSTVQPEVSQANGITTLLVEVVTSSMPLLTKDLKIPIKNLSSADPASSAPTTPRPIATSSSDRLEVSSTSLPHGISSSPTKVVLTDKNESAPLVNNSTAKPVIALETTMTASLPKNATTGILNYTSTTVPIISSTLVAHGSSSMLVSTGAPPKNVSDNAVVTITGTTTTTAPAVATTNSQRQLTMPNSTISTISTLQPELTSRPTSPSTISMPPGNSTISTNPNLLISSDSTTESRRQPRVVEQMGFFKCTQKNFDKIQTYKSFRFLTVSLCT